MAVAAVINSYRNGELDSAWRQLALIDLSKLSASDGELVVCLARDVMRTIEDCTTQVFKRLRERGYRFKKESEAIVRASEMTRRQLQEVETQIGRVPLILKCFYETFHGVDFSQHMDQCYDSSSAFYLCQMYCTLIVGSPSLSLQRWEEEKKNAEDPALLEVIGRTEPTHVERFVQTGPVLSSGEPVGFAVPSDAVDCTYYDDLLTKQSVLFVEHLRKSFSFAGFGNFARENVNDPRRVMAMELSDGLPLF